MNGHSSASLPNRSFDTDAQVRPLPYLACAPVKSDVRAHHMDAEIRQFIESIGRSAPGLGDVWLIGSRANGTAMQSSDWDFIAIGTADTLDFLKSSPRFHRADVDFLVVTDGDGFISAWGATEKRGYLSEWGWEQESATVAHYNQTKWVDRADGSDIQTTRVRAIKVWSEAGAAL
jgi:predicted nucleotidyltransferase